jgi:hypothetical protein
MRALTVALLLLAGVAGAQEQIDLHLPANLSFGEPQLLGDGRTLLTTARVSFRSTRLGPGQAVRISVRPESIAPAERDLTRSRLSFRTSGARGGTGFSGPLTGAAFLAVFDGLPGVESGSVDIEWRVELPAHLRRAGRHSLELRWKVEAVGGIPGLEGPSGPTAGAPRRRIGPSGIRRPISAGRE